MNMSVQSREYTEEHTETVLVRITGAEPQRRRERLWRPEEGAVVWRRTGGEWRAVGVWIGGPGLNPDGSRARGAQVYEPVPGGASGGTPLTAALLDATRPEGEPDGVTRMRSALLLIAGDRCRSFTGGVRCWDAGLVRGARYGADAWCDACVAADALR